MGRGRIKDQVLSVMGQSRITSVLLPISRNINFRKKAENVTSGAFTSASSICFPLVALIPMVQKEKGYSKDYIRSFSAVLQQSFRFCSITKAIYHFQSDAVY